MHINREDIKKKIFYRSAYRGSKEMDTLLSSFTKKYINTFNDEELKCLLNLLDHDDENLYKFIQGKDVFMNIKKIKFQTYLKGLFCKINDGGETGIRTQERVAPLPVFKTGAFNRSAISPLVCVYNHNN